MQAGKGPDSVTEKAERSVSPGESGIFEANGTNSVSRSAHGRNAAEIKRKTENELLTKQ